MKKLTYILTLRIFVLSFMLFFSNSLLLHSQNVIYKSLKYKSDSIIDVIKSDSYSVYLVFSNYIKIEKCDNGQYWQKVQQGIITPKLKKIFFENNEEYIGSIDNYIYTTNYIDIHSRIIKRYKLNDGELMLINNFEVVEAIGYFQVIKINEVIVYYHSSEGFGTNIILLDKDLKKIFEYKPFAGLYTDYTLNGTNLHELIFSFHSDENPREYKVLSYDLINNKVLADIKIVNDKEYLDKIFSYEDGDIIIGSYDTKSYDLIKLNQFSKQIMNHTSFDFGTSIQYVGINEVIFYHNDYLFSYNTKSFSENWRLRLNENPNENISISSFNMLPKKDTTANLENYLIVLSQYHNSTKSLVNNNLIIINNAGQLIDSVLLPKEVQFNISGSLVFPSSTGIKIYAGKKEIELIEK